MIQYKYKILVVIFFVGAINLFAQPLSPPYPFEDAYLGYPDSVMLLAKVKTDKTYYQSRNSVKSLYTVKEFNKQGRLVSQKWYNFISHNEMYSATYEYDSNGFFVLSKEKITSELDNFDFFSRKKSDTGYFVRGTPENPMGEVIPINERGELVVSTIYKKDSLDGYLADKYFFDNSFYKQEKCPYWLYNQQFYSGIYIDTNKIIEFNYSNLHFRADTIKSIDSLSISIKGKIDNEEYFKILKKNNSQTNNFEIQEIYYIHNNLKILFSSWRGGVYCITYLDQSNLQNKLLLEHRLISFDAIKQKIRLNEVGAINQLQAMNGAVFYTSFKNGNLLKEEQFSLDNAITKMQEKHYSRNNLLSSITIYAPRFSVAFGQFSESFLQSYREDSIEEIHEYEYFE
jgi:hypothetical protein